MVKHGHFNPYQSPERNHVAVARTGDVIGFWALLSVFACIANVVITRFARAALVQMYYEYGVGLPLGNELILSRAVQITATIFCVVMAAIVIREKEAPKQRRKAFIVLFVSASLWLVYIVAHLWPMYSIYYGQ